MWKWWWGIFTKLLNGTWLGHGRKHESAVSLICLGYGVQITILPTDAWETVANRGLIWHGYGCWIGTPFILTGLASGLGVVANVVGLGFPARVLRVSGAVLTIAIFMWYVFMYFTINKTGTIGFYASLVFALYAPTTIRSAMMDLPPPGAPGAR